MDREINLKEKVRQRRMSFFKSTILSLCNRYKANIIGKFIVQFLCSKIFINNYLKLQINQKSLIYQWFCM